MCAQSDALCTECSRDQSALGAESPPHGQRLGLAGLQSFENHRTGAPKRLLKWHLAGCCPFLLVSSFIVFMKGALKERWPPLVPLVGRLGPLPLHTSLIVYPLHLGDRERKLRYTVEERWKYTNGL